MESEKPTSRRRFLKYLGAAAAGLGIGTLLGSKFPLSVKATAPASTTVQPDVISTYLYTGSPGSLSYTYNADGTIATRTYGALTTSYSYNADGTIDRATSTLGNVTVTDTCAYNADGTVSGITRA